MNLIRTHRLFVGLTQAELGLRLGTSQSTVSALENGRRRITPDLADQLQKELGISTTRLVLEEPR